MRLLTVRLGLRPYGEILALQREVAEARIAGAIADDVLLLVEHPPVVTLGRSAKAAHITAPRERLAERGIEVFEVERGGDVTFHGPGQLVGYPVIDLARHKRDLHWYLRQVEEALIRALRPWDIESERSPGYTGVWTHGRKIASIGVHARGWVTWHGFALNVTTDLSYFDLMVPCGIAGVVMTSIANEIARRGSQPAPHGSRLAARGSLGLATRGSPPMSAVESEVARSFGDVFDLDPEDIAESDLARGIFAPWEPTSPRS